MSTRRLEMSVEQMKAKTTSQLAEIGKKGEAIGRLRLELGEKTAALFALEAKEKQLTEELQETQQQRDAKTAALEETERLLAEARTELATLTTTLNDSSMTVDSQRIELVTLRAQAEVLKGQIESYDKETRELHERLSRESSELETATRSLADERTNAARQLADERAKATQLLAEEQTAATQQIADERARNDTLTNRVAELERLLLAQTTECEILGRRVQELLARLDEQGRFLAEREYDSDTLRNEAASARKAEADLRAELADAEARRQAKLEALQTERNQLETQLQQSQGERAKLQDQVAAIRRETEAAWASERMENAVMRERINDVAAEVARLTSMLEGPGSQVDAILASDAARTASVPLAPMAAGESSKGSLADRIRALQSRASRVAQPSNA
jgi:chromosome segregation ATPase